MASPTGVSASEAALLDAANVQQLFELLSRLNSPNNAVRKEAETVYNRLSETNLEPLILALTELLDSDRIASAKDDASVQAVCQQAAVSLKNLLENGAVNKEPAFTDVAAEALRLRLFSTLQRRPPKIVKNATCDALAALICIMGSRWSDVSQLLFQHIANGDAFMRSAALRIFGAAITSFGPVIKRASRELCEMIGKCLAVTDDDETILQAMELLANLIQRESQAVWKPCQTYTPLICDIVKRFVEQGDVDTTTRMLYCLIDIADWNPILFKPNLLNVSNLMLQIAGENQVDTSIRRSAMEVLLCIVSTKPDWYLKLTRTINDIVLMCLQLMLSITDDSSWLTATDEPDDDTEEEVTLANMGETGIDRVTAALKGETVMPILFKYVEQYLQRPEWTYKAVGLLAISQTLEYLPEETADSHLEEIVQQLVLHLRDPHHRVRYVACQAIGQAAIDCQPEIQRLYSAQIVPALMAVLKDPVARVQGHAAAALVNYLEEVEKADIAPYQDELVEGLFELVRSSNSPRVRQLALSCISVVVAVAKEGIAKFYPLLVPVLKEIIAGGGKTEKDVYFRCVALECYSILGTAVGQEAFQGDVRNVIETSITILQTETDDTYVGYVQEALCRACACIKGDFAQYLPTLVPRLLSLVDVQGQIRICTSVDLGDEDMTFTILAKEKIGGLKTAAIEVLSHAVVMLTTFMDVLEAKYDQFLIPTSEALFPLLDFPFSAEVQSYALDGIAAALKAMRAHDDERGVTEHTMVCKLLKESLKKVLENMLPKADDGEMPDVEVMAAKFDGIAGCVRNAKGGVLTDADLADLCAKLFAAIRRSDARRAAVLSQQNSVDFDEDDASLVNDAAESEQSFVDSAIELLDGMLEVYHDSFITWGAAACSDYMTHNLRPKCSVNDLINALNIACSILKYVQDAGRDVWPIFATQLVEGIAHTNELVRRPACFGVAKAVMCPSFPEPLLKKAAELLLAMLSNPDSFTPVAQGATDNGLLALGNLIMQRASVLPNPEGCVEKWLMSLPLKADDEEGRVVHGQLLELAVRGEQQILKPEFLPKLVQICAAVYGTTFSDKTTDANIRKFLSDTGFETVVKVGANFPKKLQAGLERIHRDVTMGVSS